MSQEKRVSELSFEPKRSARRDESNGDIESYSMRGRGAEAPREAPLGEGVREGPLPWSSILYGQKWTSNIKFEIVWCSVEIRPPPKGWGSPPSDP